jgi:molybdate/tungstate transport system substrate-binding protein
MKVEKSNRSTIAYSFIIIGLIIGGAIGFGLGYLIYTPQINSLNSKVTNLQTSVTNLQNSLNNSSVTLQNSLITLASNSPPFAIGAAGTLTYAFGSVLNTFERQYPSIKVAPPLFEGSTLVAQLENTTQEFSLEAAADTTAMPSVLFPTLANYEIAFGQTQMVIIVNLESPAGLQLYNMWQDVQNLTPMSAQWNQTWQQMFTLIALNSSTVVGVSNPFTDPSGYQAAGMIRLAGLTFFGNVTYLYNAIYNNPSKYVMENTETNLIPLMQTQHIDFVISAYMSNAIPQVGNSTQTNLAYITLPNLVNLGVLSDLSYYHLANFNYTELGTTESFVVNPVIYTVTIPTSSTNAAAAALFIQTLFSQTGQSILEQNGITPLSPGIVYGNYTSVPSLIQTLVTPVNATYSSLFPGS